MTFVYWENMTETPDMIHMWNFAEIHGGTYNGNDQHAFFSRAN